MNPIELAIKYLMSFATGLSLQSLLSDFDSLDRVGQSGYHPLNDRILDNSTAFDFIIVGAGSAGCVVANRLSAENFNVLLLEAGGNPFPLTYIPSLFTPILNQKEVDWNIPTVPQKYSHKSCINQTMNINRGKALGGSGVINANMYLRGSPMDFDEWVEATGDASWKYENVLPIFKRIENYHAKFPSDEFHGTNGPLYVENAGHTPLLDEWLEAGREIGLALKDPNGHLTESVFPIPTTTKEGKRVSAYSAYLSPALGRPNLKVITYARVQKINFDKDNKAVGVSYIQGNKLYNVTASKEIILSAGTIFSPQLLMLSGIGPKQHLKSLGIEVKVNLPVGNNYVDHFISVVCPIVVDKGNSIVLERDFDEIAMKKYFNSGDGPFSVSGSFAGAVIASSFAKNGHPDIYLPYWPMTLTNQSSAQVEKLLSMKPGYLRHVAAPEFGNDSLILLVVLGKPKSTGEVRLASADPMEYPLVDPKFLSHRDDMKAIIEGIRKGQQIFTKTKAFAKVHARFPSIAPKECEGFKPDSDEYWECYTQHFSASMWHPVGTCRMGKSIGDSHAVLDSRLKVLGTTGLRVIDASVMPTITVTNSNAPTIMIAEKGSDMILEFWKSSPFRRWMETGIHVLSGKIRDP